MNFLEETIYEIKHLGLKIPDIIFIGSQESGHSCTWKEFRKLAKVGYNNLSKYHKHQPGLDLIIVFKNGARMYLYKTDISISWYCTKIFRKPKNQLKIKKLFIPGVGYENLKDFNM